MILDEPSAISFSFKGDGGKLLGIFIVNMLLIVVTLGLYYPWAKAKVNRYFHSETELEGEPFVFHGTGKEMFIGFIKSIAVIVLLYGTIFLLVMTFGFWGAALGGVLMIAFFIFAIPYAIHGSMRYQTSRTSWNQVHWGYRGKLSVFTRKFLVGYILTVLSLGIYGAWYAQSLRRYLISNVRFGNIEFNYKGDGLTYLLMNLKGILLTICTAGIYFFWYNKDIFNYTVENTSAKHGEEEITFESELTGGALFGHIITNMLLIIFTLGIGFPWAIVRTLRFTYGHIRINGNFNVENLSNTEAEYNDAMGEELGGVMETMLN